MTSTISPHDTGTHNLSNFLRPDRPRRPDATGEHPIYQPATIGIVGELQRLAVGETLVLPVDAAPLPPRPAVATVYQPAVADVRKPFLGRGSHRAASSAWAYLLVGAGLCLMAQAAAFAAALAVSGVVR